MITRRSLLFGTCAVNLLQYAGCSRQSGSANGAAIESNATNRGAVQGASVTTRATVGTSSLKGENIAGGQYWSAQELFIDLIDNAGESITYEFTDPATGDVTLPMGKEWSAILRQTAAIGSLGHVKLRPGTIRVWWDGTATTAEVRVDTPGWVKVADTGSRQIEVTIPAESAQQGGQIWIRFRNDSGGTKTLIKPHAVYADDIEAFNAGEIFDPRHLASYPPDIGVIRAPHTCFVDMHSRLDNKLSSELTYEQLVPAATSHFWRHRNNQTAALLAKRLGPDVALWINANVLMNQAGYAQMAAAIAATGFTGKIILEGGLEFWNYAYPYVMQRIRAREVIAAKIKVVDADGNSSRQEAHVDACCYAEKSLQLWEAFAKHFPQSQLIRVLTGQTAWFDIMSPMFAYRRGGTGLRCGEIYDANAIAGYAGWTDTQEMWTAGAQNYTPAQWDAEMGKRLAEVTTQIDAYKSTALERPWSRNPNYLMYEGWHHVAVYDTLNVGKASGAAAQGTLTFASSITDRISTGDFLSSSAAWNWVDAIGSPWPNRGAYARIVDATHVTLHQTAADAAANTRPLTLNSALKDTDCTNRSRSKAISDSFAAWIHSPRGVAWSDRWWVGIKQRFNSYRCIFEPKSGISTENMWGFYPPPTNVHSPHGLQLSWWRGVSDA